MARKRMVDPEFWLDEDITSMSFECRLFYIGTWNFADDYGVIENSAKKLKAQVFPYDDVDCQKMIDKLVKLKKLIPFNSEGKEWLYIRKFLKYQRVDKPSKYRNPPAPKEVLDEDSPSTQEPLNDEVKLSEVKLSEVNKETLGEFKNVLLEKKEYDRLLEKLGENNTNILIEELSGYLKSTGKSKYKDHYATLLNWARRRVTQHQERLQSKTKTIA